MTLILCLSTSVFFDPGRSMRVFFFFLLSFRSIRGPSCDDLHSYHGASPIQLSLFETTPDN